MGLSSSCCQCAFGLLHGQLGVVALLFENGKLCLIGGLARLNVLLELCQATLGLLKISTFSFASMALRSSFLLASSSALRTSYFAVSRPT